MKDLSVVKHVSKKITRCCIEADTKSLFEHYDKSKYFIFIGNNGVKLNYSNFRKNCISYYSKVKRQDLKTLKDEFKVIGEDIVMEIWTGKIIGYWKKGGTIVMKNYTVTTFYKRIKGEWKVVFVQESALPPEV